MILARKEYRGISDLKAIWGHKVLLGFRALLARWGLLGLLGLKVKLEILAMSVR